MKQLALSEIDLNNTISGEGLGIIGRNPPSTGEAALTTITNIVSAVIGFMTVVAGIWLIFQLLVGGINWISSGGDKAKLEAARDRLTNALIGVVIVSAGWAILALAGKFLGWDILISNPGNLLNVLNINP
jgi:hypothetical protein